MSAVPCNSCFHRMLLEEFIDLIIDSIESNNDEILYYYQLILTSLDIDVILNRAFPSNTACYKPNINDTV